jgi:Tfp pilus assembly protein PilO
MPKLSKTQRTGLTVLAALVLLALYGLKVLVPCVRTWAAQTDEIRRKDGLLRAHTKLADERDALESRLSSLSKGVLARLPVNRKESAFLTELGRVAKETSVHISSMNTKPPRDLDYFRELSVEIDMEANLGNLVRFLYKMRKSSVVLVANSLILEPKSERSALLKGHLIVSTIVMKEK